MISKFEEILKEEPSLKYKKGFDVPENYIFIEKINTIPFKVNKDLLDLFRYISPDMFNSPIKYISQVIQWSLEECLNVGKNKIFNLGSFWKWHYELDIMHVVANLDTLTQVLKNENHQAKNVCIQGDSIILNSEMSEIISENIQFSKTLWYFQIFCNGSNYEFLSSLLCSKSCFENLKLIEISYLFTELESLLEFFYKDRFAVQSFLKLERLVLVNQLSNVNLKPHDSHCFDMTSLDIDLYCESSKFTTNLFKFAIIGDYELEILGKRYKVTNNGKHFKLFGTKLLPNAGDYIEITVDTLFEYKIGSKFNQVKTSDTINEEIITARIPFKNVVEVSCTVYNPDFRNDGDNYSFVLNEVKRQNSKAKWSLIVENKLTHIQKIIIFWLLIIWINLTC